MGYMMLVFHCINCGGRDTGNPDKVPSIRVSRDDKGQVRADPEGAREPLCRGCVEALNNARCEAGLEPFPIAADAYEAAPA